MPPIEILATDIVQRITAGEVIDSATAVVRELAENSIDAKSDRIIISIWTESDLFSVQVSDNGIGMDQFDLIQALLAHSTSKILSITDLENISSLGFRGEALHSMTQFSHLTIASRPIGGSGYEIKFKQKTCSNPTPCAMAPGTIVTVRNLFEQYPHRLKALPDRSQQLRQLQKQIHDLAVTHPFITWQVNLEHRPWFTLWGNSTMKATMLQLLQNLTENDMIEDTQTDGTLLLGLPDRVSRRRSDWVKTAINGRRVVIPELEQSIFNGFNRCLPRHRYPICVVHLQIDRTKIDWNRHPAKTEVYLHHLSEWQNRIESWIKQLLHSPQTSISGYGKKLLKLAEPQNSYSTQSVPASRIVGQLHNIYIIIEQESGIYLVEQHVAHERILFEQIEHQWEITALPNPILVNNLTPNGVENLQRSGIEIESFGDRVWRISSLPQLLLDHPEPIGAIHELSHEETPGAIRARVACLAAIRNGTNLDMTKMESIIHDWERSQNPHTCPHGRPIYLRLTSEQLAHFFHRR